MDDPKVVTLILAISDVEKVKARVDYKETKNLMLEAGIEGVTEIFYHKLAE